MDSVNIRWCKSSDGDLYNTDPVSFEKDHKTLHYLSDVMESSFYVNLGSVRRGLFLWQNCPAALSHRIFYSQYVSKFLDYSFLRVSKKRFAMRDILNGNTPH